MRMCRTSLRLMGFILGVFGLIAAGCGGSIKHVPVAGKVTLNGDEKALAGFVVSFNADPDKGHQHTRISCTSRIGQDGSYSLTTDDGFKPTKGAPLGWYKVTLMSPNDLPIPANKKYTDFNKTDMAVEVVESAEPGAYDLKFTK
jgi:hypothetical protein